MRRIFIIRHGNTFENSAQARRIGAGTDIPLVSSGLAQADKLGHYFKELRLGSVRLLSGPLLRARETAERIGAAIGHSPDGTTDWLDEIDHGPDEGQPEADVLARIGAEALAGWDAQGVVPPGWIAHADRRIAAWRAVFAQGSEGTDLLVTSNGAARFALLDLPDRPATLKLHTGAFCEVRVGEQGNVTLARWNVRPD